MSFLKELGLTAKARTQRAAVLNRLRTVLRCKKRAIEKEYLALGRYYYNALRDKNNSITEGHCANIDQHQDDVDRILNTLEGLEQAAFFSSDGKSAASIAVISGADGPSAVFVTERRKPAKKKEGTLFHFHKGPVEVTVSREPAQDSQPDPSDENAEIVDLQDVQVFDQDPIAEAPAAPAELNTPPASPDENDSLPFEG